LAAVLALRPTGSATAADAGPGSRPATGTQDRATVLVHPGDDVAGIVARSAEGTIFDFAAGIYRLLEIAPKDGDSFIGEPGAILSGARVISGFDRDGGVYVTAVDVQPRPVHGSCRPGRVCDRPNDLFVDGVRQEPVLELEEVGPGHFFIDYKARKLYLGSDPTGKTVELGTASYAFAGPAEYVRIGGLVIEKYANAAQTGAIGGDGHPVHWTIEDCEVRDNHGAGVKIGDHSRVSHNLIHRNGQLGISGSGSHLVVDDNELADNNQAGFDSGWEAGGLKVTRSIHALIEANFAHDNHGPGLWTDIDNVDTVYEANRVEDNDGPGIQHEISFEAVIRNNKLRGNGKTAHSWVWGAQILVQNSRDVDVHDNRVVVPEAGYGIILVEQRRERGPFGPHVVRECTIAHNAINMAGESGVAAGIATDYGGSRVDRGGNRFEGNSYRVPDAGGRFWAWPSWGDLSFETFQRRYGQEATGIVTVGRSPR
jgi:hypothetical protein